jgi:hypothetical protein
VSAFLVNSDTLDLLASACTLYGLGTSRETYVYLRENQAAPSQGLILQNDIYGMRHLVLRGGDENNIVRELWAANVESLRARYDDATKLIHDDLLSNTWRPILDVPMNVIMGALNCYEYQSCEADTWIDSFAKAICDALRNKLCRIISNGEWEYERPSNYVDPVSLMSIIKP